MKYTLTILLFVFLTKVYGQNTGKPITGEVVFRDVNVIPMDQERVVPNQTIVVKDGKITAITSTNNAKYSKEATVVEANGKYLLPGLAEMHAHVPPVDDLAPMQEVLTLFAVNGITTIRGMLGHPRHLELRNKINSGEILGPHFYTTGPSFSGQSVKTPAQAAAMVREQKQAGYNYLKLHPGLSLETFKAMAQAAKEVNIPFVGHVSFKVGIWRAVAAGYSSIDHLDGFVEGMVPGIEAMTEQQAGLFGMFVADRADTTQIPKLMQALKEQNTWVVPTQALAERWFAPVAPDQFMQAPEMVYMSAEVRQNWESSKRTLQANPQYKPDKIKEYTKLRRRLILACQQNGVGLLLGCDAPQVFNVPGFSTHQELQYLVAAGLTPYEALRTGTVNVATYLNQAGKAGIIKVGAPSDLILLDGNPLKDIKQTQNIAGVMLGNNWLPKAYLQQELRKLAKP